MASTPPNSPNASPAPEGAPLDSRYSALVEELALNMQAALDGLTPPLSDEQRIDLDQRWRREVVPPLLKQLDALVGPAKPVIAEACEAYNWITSSAAEEESDSNVCKGRTVAVVMRRGRPESPGGVAQHYPGCEKHAMKAMASMSRLLQRPGARNRVFFSVIELEDARREIRQQELLVAHLPQRGSRWWSRRR